MLRILVLQSVIYGLRTGVVFDGIHIHLQFENFINTLHCLRPRAGGGNKSPYFGAVMSNYCKIQ